VARIRINPSEMRAVVNAFARRDAERVADQTIERARILAGTRFNVQTGRYRNGFQKRSKFTARGPGWEVFNPVSYAPYLEEGTKPHIIRPKTKKALRFKVGGRTVFAAFVNHPGTKAGHVLTDAVRQAGIANGYNVQIG
jgi:hypothetical protein